MERVPLLISGVVRDPAGNPVPEARVYFTSGPVPLPEIAALTDAGGQFTLSVPAAGTYGLECNADGFASEAVTVRAKSGEDSRVAVTLKKA
jgi:hypothetical protein